MKSLGFGSYTLSSCVAAAMLAACGGSQIGGQELPQERMGSNRALPRHAMSGDLLYVVGDNGGVAVFTYPQRKALTTFTVGSGNLTACVDKSGDVFIPSVEGGGLTATIYEFAHGGTSPIATLSDPGQAAGCSVDPTTGNLAVANYSNQSDNAGNIAVYIGAKGSPTIYSDEANFIHPTSVSYDNQGNLFVGGYGQGGDVFQLAEIDSGSSTFTGIEMSKQITGAVSIQWTGKVLAITSTMERLGSTYVYQVKISGSSGTIIGTTSLHSHSNQGRVMSPYSWIQGKTIIVPVRKGAGFWLYPNGGAEKNPVEYPYGHAESATVSPAS
jgi:hypothetical protein